MYRANATALAGHPSREESTSEKLSIVLVIVTAPITARLSVFRHSRYRLRRVSRSCLRKEIGPQSRSPLSRSESATLRCRPSLPPPLLPVTPSEGERYRRLRASPGCIIIKRYKGRREVRRLLTIAEDARLIARITRGAALSSLSLARTARSLARSCIFAESCSPSGCRPAGTRNSRRSVSRDHRNSDAKGISTVCCLVKISLPKVPHILLLSSIF